MLLWNKDQVATELRVSIQRAYTLQDIAKVDLIGDIVDDDFAAFEARTFVWNLGVDYLVQLLSGPVR